MVGPVAVWVDHDLTNIIYKLFFCKCWYFVCLQVCVRAGIYHGSEALCDIQCTQPEGSSNPFWNQFLDFDLNVHNIPRMARLCLVIYSVYLDRRKTKSKKREVKMRSQLAFTGHLKSGTMFLASSTPIYVIDSCALYFLLIIISVVTAFSEA